jgi:hypothetical protein
VNSVTAQRPTFAQPYGGSSISHLLAVARVVVITAAQQRRTMRGSPPLLGRIASGGCWRDDAAGRRARSHCVVNSVTAQPHTFAQPQDGSSTLHLLAVARAVVIAAAQLSAERARLREEWPLAWRLALRLLCTRFTRKVLQETGGRSEFRITPQQLLAMLSPKP